MGNDTKAVAHEGMDMGTGIFSKCGYEDGHGSTLPIGYPLPSLLTIFNRISFSTYLFHPMTKVEYLK